MCLFVPETWMLLSAGVSIGGIEHGLAAFASYYYRQQHRYSSGSTIGGGGGGSSSGGGSSDSNKPDPEHAKFIDASLHTRQIPAHPPVEGELDTWLPLNIEFGC